MLFDVEGERVNVKGRLTRSAELRLDQDNDVYQISGGGRRAKARQEGSCLEGRHHGFSLK